MGTPDFAVPALKALIASQETHRWTVAAVVTQPDRPSGRGKKLRPPPVKVVATEAGIPVLQPKTLKAEAAFADLAALTPDIVIVAAFGQILQRRVLDLPPHGCLNIHASLLPRWRGAAPVAAAIRAGDSETGITLMHMDEGLDTGNMLVQRSLPIRADHTRDSLTTDLAELGATLLVETLPAWIAGDITAQPQDDSRATYAPRLKKEAGAINWQQSAAEITRHVRAFQPWPGSFTEGPRGAFKVLHVAQASVSPPKTAPPGTVFKHQKDVFVTTGDGVIQLITVQPAGKKAMPAEAMVNGQPDLIGTQLAEA